MKENKITINNLVYALLFLVFGIILLTSTEDIIGMVSKILGIIFIIVGIVKSIIYIYMKGKLGEYNLSELIVGLLIIGCGTLFIICSSALSFAIRLIVGLWVLLAGINKIILAISLKKFDNRGFAIYLSTAFIMIIVGVLLISGLLDQIIGLLIIIYSITEIVDYIYFICKYKKYENNIKTEKTTKSKGKKRIKSKKTVDAIIEEKE